MFGPERTRVRAVAREFEIEWNHPRAAAGLALGEQRMAGADQTQLLPIVERRHAGAQIPGQHGPRAEQIEFGRQRVALLDHGRDLAHPPAEFAQDLDPLLALCRLHIGDGVVTLDRLHRLEEDRLARAGVPMDDALDVRTVAAVDRQHIAPFTERDEGLLGFRAHTARQAGERLAGFDPRVAQVPADPLQSRARRVEELARGFEDLVETAHQGVEITEANGQRIGRGVRSGELGAAQRPAHARADREKPFQFDQLVGLEQVPFDPEPGEDRIDLADVDRTGVVPGDLELTHLTDAVESGLNGDAIGQRT